MNRALLVVGLMAAFFCGSAFAGNGSGNVTQVGAVENGIVVFSTVVHTGTPTCVATQQWAINTTTVQGKGIYALLLTAVNDGKAVTVTGGNVCDVYGGIETAIRLYVNY
ncbi:MAG TPA: hypothetical protein VGC19_05565 [Rhodanobacter sp.]